MGKLLCLVVFLGLSGCARAIQAGTEAGVEGSLEAMREKENREQLAVIARSPEVDASLNAIGQSLTHGMVEALKEEVTGVDDGSAAEIVSGVGDHTESLIREHVAPGVAEVVAQSVDASLEAGSSEENLAHSRRITEAIARGMTAALAQGIREDIMPALAEADSRLAPAATDLLEDEELKQALGSLAHEVSREIVLGSESALDTIERQQDPHRDGSFFGGLAQGLGIGVAALVALFAVVATAFIVLVVLVVRGSSRRRQLERDNRQREVVLLELMRTLVGDGSGLTKAQRERVERAGLTSGSATPAPAPG